MEAAPLSRMVQEMETRNSSTLTTSNCQKANEWVAKPDGPYAAGFKKMTTKAFKRYVESHSGSSKKGTKRTVPPNFYDDSEGIKPKKARTKRRVELSDDSDSGEQKTKRGKAKTRTRSIGSGRQSRC